MLIRPFAAESTGVTANKKLAYRMVASFFLRLDQGNDMPSLTKAPSVACSMINKVSELRHPGEGWGYGCEMDEQGRAT